MHQQSLTIVKPCCLEDFKVYYLLKKTGINLLLLCPAKKYFFDTLLEHLCRLIHIYLNAISPGNNK